MSRHIHEPEEDLPQTRSELSAVPSRSTSGLGEIPLLPELMRTAAIEREIAPGST